MNNSNKNSRNDEVPVSGKAKSLDSVIFEVTALYQRLRVAAEEVHRFGRLSAGKRGILRGLHRNGPQTVPQMARARFVSRQHIQSIVNFLSDEGLVEFIKNPAHMRSKLARLTEKGIDIVNKMNKQEAKLLDKLVIDIPETELLKTAEILRKVRESFEGEG
jgi:DNA-binding MarR family transcriptional regulator